MNKRIWLSLAHMGGREQDFIKEAFDTNWVVPLGPNVDAFEQSLVEYLHEDRRVVALSAGTAALHLGLILLGIKPGDEVICQSFTFAASANPISYLEAKPVFVDSEKDTWNMDPV
ncbi:degT/DnrJ/EryC1/StrS aminotransferase family protein, partial [Bacteroides fragilis str. S13 L11]